MGFQNALVPEQVANVRLLLGWDAQLRKRNGVAAAATPKIIVLAIFFSLLVAPSKIHDASAHLGTQLPAKPSKTPAKTPATAAQAQRCRY
jgi:hypothetical protein